MSIDRLRGRLRRSQALRYEIKNSGNLLARHVELFHYFLDAQVLKIFDHGCHGQPRILEQPVAAHLAGNAFDCGALGLAIEHFLCWMPVSSVNQCRLACHELRGGSDHGPPSAVAGGGGGLSVLRVGPLPYGRGSELAAYERIP